MKDSTPALQDALIAFLTTHATSAALIGSRAYDRAPQGVVFPYVSLGRSRTERFRMNGKDGVSVYLELHVWSRAASGGAYECRSITAALAGLLDEQALTVAGHHLVGLFVEDTEPATRLGDGLSHQGTINLRADTLAA